MAENTTTRIVEVQVNTSDAVKLMAEYELQLEKSRKAEQDLKAAVKERGEASQEDRQQLAALKEQQKAYSSQIRELSREVQNNIKTEQLYKNTLKGLGAELSNAKDKLRGMQLGTAAYAKQEKTVAALNQRMKEAEQAYGVFSRDVGNYEKAAKGLRTQIRELTEQLVAMKMAGQENSEQYRELSARAAELNDAMSDVNQQTRGLASDTANLDALMQSAQGLSAAWGLYNSVLGTTIKEDSEAAQVMKNLQIAMTALASLTTLKNTLQKQSIVMQKASAVATWAQTKAEIARTAATAAGTVATNAGTAAVWKFTAALFANPIGVLIAAIIAAVAAVYALVKAFSWFNSSSEKAKANLKKQGEELDNLGKKYDEHIEKMKALGKNDEEVTLAHLSLLKDLANKRAAHFEEAKRLYEEDSEEYKAALEAKNKADEDYRVGLNDTANHLRSLASSYNDEVLKKKLGAVEYATLKANEEFDNQRQQLKKLRAEGKITYDEMGDLLQSMVNIRDKAIKDATVEAYEAAAEKRAQALKTELADIRAALDAEIALMADGAAKDLATENERHNRKIEDLRKRLETEKNLTEAARAAINRMIEAEEQQHTQNIGKLKAAADMDRIKQEEQNIALRLAAVKRGTDEEFSLKMEQLQKQQEAELASTELTEQQKALIVEKYNAERDALAEQQKQIRIDRQADEIVREYETRIGLMQKFGADELSILQEQVAQKQAILDNLHQVEGESNADFGARQLAAKADLTAAQTALDEALAAKEVEIEQTKQAALANLKKSAMELLDELGESNKAFAIMSKTITLAEIAVNTGKAIAAGTAQAMSVPFPGNLVAIATTVATIMANITSAIKTVKSAKFAAGGYVDGPGTATSDSIPARLSAGESVNAALPTSMFAPIYSALNQLGGGAPIVATQSSNQIAGEEMLARAFAKGVSQLDMRVGVDEITRVADRVKVVESLGDI